MASTICQVSQSLRRLTLCETDTSGDVGLSFLSELADSQVASLEYINFNSNLNWFKNEKCVGTLCKVLQRQGSLQVLRLACDLTDDQVQKIRAAVQTQDCRVITTKQEDKAYGKELYEIKKAEEAAKKAEEDAKKAAAEAAKK